MISMIMVIILIIMIQSSIMNNYNFMHIIMFRKVVFTVLPSNQSTNII